MVLAIEDHVEACEREEAEDAFELGEHALERWLHLADGHVAQDEGPEGQAVGQAHLGDDQPVGWEVGGFERRGLARVRGEPLLPAPGAQRGPEGRARVDVDGALGAPLACEGEAQHPVLRP